MPLSRGFFLSKITSKILVVLCLTYSNLYANEIVLDGTIQHALPQSKVLSMRSASNKTPKSIALLKLNLSPNVRHLLQKNISRAINNQSNASLKSQYYNKVQLGMNNVPVLNQGSHGTCVVFAVTAAIDAALNKGDYISQLCTLQLGQYLEKNSYLASGWDGSWAGSVLGQISAFGLVNKTQQRANNCGSLTDYPLVGNVPDQDLSPETFHSMSESLDQHGVSWSSVLDSSQIIVDGVSPNVILNMLKTAISHGERLTIGVLLFNLEQGTIGAVGTHNAMNDTWVITSQMAKDFNEDTELAGHEMIVTGYDDYAIAKDDKGTIYHGLFTLRNSWGPEIGDHGDFYMSYDYMKYLIIEANRIRTF